jgi:enoyl-CoA hydratase/carnithine racemase
MSENPVLFHQKKGVGVITLNRPDSLNSLNFEMISRIRKQLLLWKEDTQIHVIILKSDLEKALCAGGDLKEIYQAKKRGDTSFMKAFFKEEYALNQLIFSYPKPYISLMNGITMGGGMGISVHGSHRIVSDSSLLAMPEVFIGFFPDVGASYFLNRCLGKTGILLGLSGYRMNAADALYTGLATHYVPEENLPLLFKSFVETDISAYPKEGIHAILEMLSSAPPMVSKLEENRSAIDSCFDGADVGEIIATLTISKNSWMKNIKNRMEVASPLSLKISHHLLTQAKKKTFSETMDLELDLAYRFFENEETLEGIRSLIIDKDRNPNWKYRSIEDVPESIVKSYF